VAYIRGGGLIFGGLRYLIVCANFPFIPLLTLHSVVAAATI
jgi:hypothetical protein